MQKLHDRGYVAEVKLLKGSDILRIDQSELETVIQIFIKYILLHIIICLCHCANTCYSVLNSYQIHIIKYHSVVQNYMIVGT